MPKAKKLPSGNWRVLLYIGTNAEGKRQYKSFTAETKKEAEYLAAQYNQLKIDVNRSNMPLSDAVERYIKSKENVLSPSTVRGYYAILNNNLPALMAMRIRDLNAEIIQEEFNKFAKDHSPKTCRNAHGLISAVLKIHRPEIILNTTLPQKSKREIYVPDAKEIIEIYDKTVGTSIEIPFLLATQCGLRASEISALETSCVFPDHIEIKQARVSGVDGAVLKAPKSYAGYRNIPISNELYEVLVAHAKDNRICPLNSSNISTEWGRFRAKYKINSNCNFHALRHHFASRCLLMGMPQKYTAELMGHSSLDMIERVYQHTFPSAMEIYAAKLRRQNSEFMQHEMQHENL